MACPRCGAEPPEGSAFCNACGAPMAAASSAAPPRVPSGPEPERELWRGRFSGWALAHGWVLWALWGTGLAFAWFGLLPGKIRGNPSTRYVLAGSILLPLLALLGELFIRKISVRYRLTTHRLFRERGLFFRRFDEVELIRVDDVAVRQNLVQRVFNAGDVIVYSPTDPTEPRLELRGIANPIGVKEEIRSRVRRLRERSLHVESL